MFEFFKKSKKLTRVHVVGVGGIGVSRIAFYYRALGLQVTGSDLYESEITTRLRDAGVQVTIGHSEKNVPEKCNLLVFSVAIAPDNPERVTATKRKIKQLSHFQAIQQIAQGKKIIAVCGTNGKSTTTAMLGFIFERAGLDPTVFVGSLVSQWQGNIRIGKGPYFIVEADELDSQFLSLKPFGIGITKIELDHLDSFRDLRDIRDAYSSFVGLLPKDGFLVFNHDDTVTMEVVNLIKLENMSGFGRQGRSIHLLHSSVLASKQHIATKVHGVEQEFTLSIAGSHNVYNALAAIGATSSAQIPFKLIQETLEEFKGIWRRFEILGFMGKALIISDYGHHPSAVRTTLEGAREFFPGKKILLVFQPHQLQRTRALFDDFVSVLSEEAADGIILVEIFQVAGRENSAVSVSSRDLALAVSRNLPEVYYAPTLGAAQAKIRSLAPAYDLIIVMGARDVYTVAERLVEKKHE